MAIAIILVPAPDIIHSAFAKTCFAAMSTHGAARVKQSDLKSDNPSRARPPISELILAALLQSLLADGFRAFEGGTSFPHNRVGLLGEGG